MADVRPFRGLRYNLEAVGDAGSVLSQPFDVISPSEQRELYQRTPYNVVRLELPEGAGDDRYAAAAETLSAWLESGVMVRDEAPSYYVTRHEFRSMGRSYVRTGLTAAVRVEPFDTGAVKPHEITRKGPKVDRLKLMEATKANISPLMMMYQGSADIRDAIEKTQAAETPVVAQTASGETVTSWAVSDTGVAARLRQAFETMPLYMADGHHRYETALIYRDQVDAATRNTSPDDAHRFVMATLIEFDDPGLLNLPYHRVFKGLDEGTLVRLDELLQATFVLERRSMNQATPDEVAVAGLEGLSEEGVLFQVWGLEPGNLVSLRLKNQEIIRVIARGGNSLAWAGLGATVFREAVLHPLLEWYEEEAEYEGRMAFAKDAAEAVEQVNAGELQLLFMPKAVPMNALKEVSDRGERLPPKATFFYPKLLTGLVLKSLEGPL
ncbi:MAG: DUF1015 domain-containing protein [Chloroflexi bacterium]|nr:DUF1015 domain-containing protein [Chloroflexota bacterium]